MIGGGEDYLWTPAIVNVQPGDAKPFARIKKKRAASRGDANARATDANKKPGPSMVPVRRLWAQLAWLVPRSPEGPTLGKHLRHRLRLYQLAGLVEVVMDDGGRADADRVVD